jgi:outer membrane lipoprotein carrier protein
MIASLTMAVLLAQATPPAPAPKAPAASVAKSTPEGLALARKMQGFYEKTSDFSADFSQTYKYKGSARKAEFAGTVQVKKPGLMRWDYTKPYPKQLVLDGKALYLYEPEDKVVQVKKDFSTDSMSAAVTFLWGKGNLADSFFATKIAKPDYGATVLELTPKKPENGFTKLYFAIDDVTGSVTKSVIFDTGGNENRITFMNVKRNRNLPESQFKFEIPKGAQVTNMP